MAATEPSATREREGRLPVSSPTAPAATLDQPRTLPSGLVLPNRIAKAAMTENLADADNQPTARLEQLYRTWADGGAGLLLTGNLGVDRRYLERSRNVVADALVDSTRLAAYAASTGDVPVLAQLNHPGRQTNRFLAWTPVAPSTGPAVSMLGAFGRPRALEDDEVDAIVDRFVAAAVRCRDAGFDGVQVHAAHGYLLAQFLSPATNRRADRWGGDVARRAHALLEVVRRTRAATGNGFTIAVKLNSSDFLRGGLTEDDAAAVARMLDEVGIDLLEVSGGTYESGALLGLAEGQAATGTDREAYFAGFAARIADQVTAPIMLTGGIRSRGAMDALLGSGVVDVIGLARPLAMAPDLPARLLDGRTDTIELPDHRVPGPLELAGESEWYEAQLARLADGRDPDPELDHLRMSLAFVAGEAWRGMTSGRRRRRLAAEAAGAPTVVTTPT